MLRVKSDKSDWLRIRRQFPAHAQKIGPGQRSSSLVPRGRAPFDQHQESRPLASSNNGSPRFTDFPLLCACSESSLTNLIGSGFSVLCLQIHSKPECRWTWPEVSILGADQKERDLWGREWRSRYLVLTKSSTGSGDENARSSIVLGLGSIGTIVLHIIFSASPERFQRASLRPIRRFS